MHAKPACGSSITTLSRLQQAPLKPVNHHTTPINSLAGLQVVDAGEAGFPVFNNHAVQVALHDHSHGQVVLAVGHAHQLRHAPVYACGRNSTACSAAQSV